MKIFGFKIATQILDLINLEDHKKVAKIVNNYNNLEDIKQVIQKNKQDQNHLISQEKVSHQEKENQFKVRVLQIITKVLNRKNQVNRVVIVHQIKINIIIPHIILNPILIPTFILIYSLKNDNFY